MERTTEALPAVRPEVPAAPERDAIADAGINAFSGDNSFGLKPANDQLRIAAATNGDNTLDFSTARLYSSVFDGGASLQMASLRLGDDNSDPSKPKASPETMRRIGEAVEGLVKGDISKFQSYLRDMSNTADPMQKRDLQGGMNTLTQYMREAGVDAKMVMGNLQITLPGKGGKILTIDKEGRTNLQGNELRNFGKKFGEVLDGDDKDTAKPLSDRMTSRLDRIEAALKRTNLTGLQDAIKEIGDKIHSVKPGSAGASERKEAQEIQSMLETLSDELSNHRVNANYDRQSGTFSITQANARGQDETLTIDKFGRANMSGEKLRFFLIQMRDNREKQPTISV